jgi:nucleoside-specific outer membrane channel protein Tsx
MSAPAALAQDQPSFSVSNVNVRYGWTFQEPAISEDVPKNVFTFENTAGGRWWSSYLFVDVLRSWSDADANAKEVYGEWYPTLSLRALTGRERSKGVLADVGFTVGLNTGVRSTGPSPFVVLPGLTFSLNVPGFTFLSVNTLAYIDRGRFQGQPTDCTATAFQVTPSWSLPIRTGRSTVKVNGFVDFTTKHANCEANSGHAESDARSICVLAEARCALCRRRLGVLAQQVRNFGFERQPRTPRSGLGIVRPSI